SAAMDRGVESESDRDRRILRRAQRRPTSSRTLHAVHRRHATAIQFLPGPVTLELSAVRQRERVVRHEHAAAVDVPAGRRPVRRLQPQRAVHPRPLAAGFQSTAGQTSIRVADLVWSDRSRRHFTTMDTKDTKAWRLWHARPAIDAAPPWRRL